MRSQLAPIVLFVYNRPWHTEQTLTALMQNGLAEESTLYIYSDGAKNSGFEEAQKVKEVRNLIRSKKWCNEVNIIESDNNKGLADSIKDGVTEIVNKYGKIIVLEDDIVTSKGFLKYLNDALAMYEKEEKVFHISGYMFPVKGKLPKTFFYKQTSCWGWATWADKWKIFEPSAKKLYEKLQFSGKIEQANIDGTNQFVRHLKENAEGSLKTWAVLWHFSVYFQDGLCLHPNKSLVQNIGLDNSGSNCEITDKFDVKLSESIKLKKILVKDNPQIYGYLNEFYNGKRQNKDLIALAVNSVKALIPARMRREIKILIGHENNELEVERKRLVNLPRFTETEVIFLKKKIKIVDIASFNFIEKEIFKHEIYKFNCKSDHPYIIDCGANIGLSIIYFKQRFPNAKIVAFEPDDKVFKTLEHNKEIFDLTNVELIKKACWHEETVLRFYSEGADAGRAAKYFDEQNIIEVPTVRLRDYINNRVDFLKIDIEGAENEVLMDIQDLLINVDKIFVEFHSFVGQEQMLPEILSVLKNAGFRFNISSPGLNSGNPFIKINTYLNMDNQLNIYGYRL